MAAPGWPAREAHWARQVAGRLHGRPCGAPRTGSVIEGIEIINRGIHSPIYTQYFPLFSPCGTMFPHGLTLQVTWTRGERPISSRTATIAWTRVHAIIKSTTCAKGRVSDEDRTTYLAPRGNPRTSQSASNRRA